MANYRILSSDNHVVEPPDLWTDRVQPKFKDRSPQMVRQDDGDWWICDEQRVMGASIGTQAGRRFDEPEKMVTADFFENVPRGGYIPEDHVKDLDADGVEVSVLYPSIGLLLYRVENSELLTDVFRAYNDWLAEFCRPFPDRLKGIAMVNVDDVQVGIQELERSANMGLIGAMIACYPQEGKNYGMPEYDPFWAAAQDLDIPISLHAATNRAPTGAVGQPSHPFLINMDFWMRMDIAEMTLKGVFERYPNLLIGSVEFELDWIPHFLDRMDYAYTQRPSPDDKIFFKNGMLPSDFFHRNVFVSFQEDAKGIQDRHIIGIDQLMWGADYPHQEGTFPRSQQVLEEILADCTEGEKAKIAGANVARLYHLD